jgi:tetratricopeptide (TPR) repeat protein
MIAFMKPSFLPRLALFLAMLSISMPCNTWAGETLSVPEQRILYRAQQAMDKEEFGKVRDLLSSYLTRHPDTQPALFFLTLGNACFQSADLERAAHWYQKGFDKHPDDVTLCRNLAAARYGLEQFNKAGKLFEKGYQLATPKEPELLYQAGVAYYQAEQFTSCRAVLETLFKATDKRAKPWMRLMIQVCYEQKDFTRAENLLTEFLEIYPQEKEYWKLLAGIQTELGRYKAAVGSLSLALATGNPTPQEWEELASLYLYLNAPLQAAKYLEKAVPQASGPKKNDAIARAYLRAHRYDDALRHLDRAIAKESTPARIIAKTKVLMTARRFAEATIYLEQNMNSLTDLDEAYLLAGYCYLEMQNWAQTDLALRKIKKDTAQYPQAQNILQNIKPFLTEE